MVRRTQEANAFNEFRQTLGLGLDFIQKPLLKTQPVQLNGDHVGTASNQVENAFIGQITIGQSDDGMGLTVDRSFNHAFLMARPIGVLERNARQGAVLTQGVGGLLINIDVGPPTKRGHSFGHITAPTPEKATNNHRP